MPVAKDVLAADSLVVRAVALGQSGLNKSRGGGSRSSSELGGAWWDVGVGVLLASARGIKRGGIQRPDANFRDGVYFRLGSSSSGLYPVEAFGLEVLRVPGGVFFGPFDFASVASECLRVPDGESDTPVSFGDARAKCAFAFSAVRLLRVQTLIGSEGKSTVSGGFWKSTLAAYIRMALAQMCRGPL
jgi:hypothetical protein